MIRRLLENQPELERIAVIDGEQRLRYIDLLQKAWGIRPFLPQGQQERVAILLPNGGDYIAAVWGTVMCGHTAFPLNHMMTIHELLPLLKQASVSTVITASAFRSVFDEIPKPESNALNIIFMDDVQPAVYPEHVSADVDSDKPMLLLSTSGTTGKSKIVQLSERNIEASVSGYLGKLHFDEAQLSVDKPASDIISTSLSKSQGQKLTADIRYILAVPFSSVYGMMIISACLIQSFPLIVLEDAFTLDSLYRTAEKHKATHYEGSATAVLLMEQMAGRAIPHDIRTLKYFGFGGSKVSGSTIEKLMAAYPDMEFYQGYGMTEAAPLIAKHPHIKLEKTDSVGTAVSGMEIAVESENKITRKPFTQGEIVVRGANVMSGYLDNPSETDKVLKNGYLYTGDIGYLDNEGYLYICGRKKNVIIVRGFNVYPEEIEACIQNSLLAKDCIVYGKTDADGRETVCADIVPIHPQVGKDEIRAYCSTHLVGYKMPKRISFCAFINKNASGKTKRNE